MGKAVCKWCRKKQGRDEQFTTSGFCLPCSQQLHQTIDNGKAEINQTIELIRNHPGHRCDPETAEAATTALLKIHQLESFRKHVPFFKSSLDEQREFLERVLRENGAEIPKPPEEPVQPPKSQGISNFRLGVIIVATMIALAIFTVWSSGFWDTHTDVSVKDGHFTISMQDFTDRLISNREFKNLIISEKYNCPRYNLELQNDVSFEMMSDETNSNEYITNIWITTDTASEDSVFTAYSSAYVCIDQLYPSWTQKKVEAFLLDIINGANDSTDSGKTYTCNYESFRWSSRIDDHGLRIIIDCLGESVD